MTIVLRLRKPWFGKLGCPQFMGCIKRVSHCSLRCLSFLLKDPRILDRDSGTPRPAKPAGRMIEASVCSRPLGRQGCGSHPAVWNPALARMWHSCQGWETNRSFPVILLWSFTVITWHSEWRIFDEFTLAGRGVTQRWTLYGNPCLYLIISNDSFQGTHRFSTLFGLTCITPVSKLLSCYVINI